MNTFEVLRAARTYISDPEYWHQGGFAHNDAVCAAGACGLAATGRPSDSYILDTVAHSALLALQRAAEGLFDCLPERVNDHMGHAAVLAMFDRAIAVEEAKAAEFDATAEPAPLVAA